MGEVRGKEAGGLANVINRLAGLVTHGGGVLTAADQAVLRRMDPRRIEAPFFKLCGVVLDDQLPGELSAREALETRWAAILVGLAHLGDLHRPGARLGRSLVTAGFSDQRFSRLLHADEERLIDEIPALARFVTAKGVPADWSEAAWLLLSAGRRDEERARRSIARDYYSELS